MKVFTLKRWGDFSKVQKLGVIGGMLVFCLIIGTCLSLVFGNDPSSIPSQESLPVTAQVGDIAFSSEVVKHEPQGQDYFVNYRLKREVARQEAKEMLAPLLNSNVEKNRGEAQEKWLQLTHKIEKEDQIENLLKISGIQDGVADLGTNEVAVIVYSPMLSPEEIKLIQDAVLRVTDMAKEQIRISYRY